MTDFFDNGSFNPNQSIGSQGATKPAGGDERNQNLAHVSLSQIAKYTTEEGLIVHGQKVKTLCVVGFVESIEEVMTRNTYMLRDFTTEYPLEVQLWKNDSSETGIQNIPTVMEKTYVRVFGQAKYDEKRPFIIAFRITPIQHPLEVEEHLMECFVDSIILEKGVKGESNGTLSMMDMDTSTHGGNNALGGSGFGSDGFSEVQKLVMNLLKANTKYSGSVGMHRDDIKQKLTSINGGLVDKAIQYLSEEGHVYTTKDDDTFQCIEV